MLIAKLKVVVKRRAAKVLSVEPRLAVEEQPRRCTCNRLDFMLGKHRPPCPIYYAYQNAKL